ncbi:hypothetical protein GH714_022954 [Hevea brasiliensis]|uniref:Uncharacterized protein n=1 Tax=Hevea brasiliensis TaxID=3981 RepID=A0A6A6KCH9_HEVBR|nr:hypothetical protein GH714_022954 [Hevea brasiliensis]
MDEEEESFWFDPLLSEGTPAFSEFCLIGKFLTDRQINLGFAELNHPKDSSPMMDAIFQEQDHTNYIDPFASFHADNSHSQANMSHANMSNSHDDSDVLMGSTDGMYQVDRED